MKIILKNFRCYQEKTFEINDNLMTLISGSSGGGKTTILNAILFCLYGVGKKLQSYNKKSCSVELHIEDLIIIRTKAPNKLTLNSTYEDDVAQEIINKKFGTSFDVVSYIQQNIFNSFIIMSPTEKLEFLEKFAFKDVDIAILKDKCKEEISKKKDELNKTISQIEISTKMFEGLKKPEDVKFPLKVSEKNYENITKNEQIKLKNCDTRIKKARIEKDKYQKELTDIKILKTVIQSNNDQINKLSDELIELNNEDIDYEGDEKLEENKKILENILATKEIRILKNKLEEDNKKLQNIKQDELENLNKELKNINKIQWIEYTKEEAMETIKSLKECLMDIKKISIFKKQLVDNCITTEELENIKNELEKSKNELDNNNKLLEKIKIEKTIYVCPSCDNKLNFKNNELCLIEDDITSQFNKLKINESEEEISSKIQKLKNIIKKQEKIISQSENNIANNIKTEKDINEIISQYDDELDEESITNDLQNINEYYNNQLSLEKTKINIENKIINEIFSSSYNIFLKEIAKLQIKITKLEKNCDDIDEEIDEEELRNKINTQDNNKNKLYRILKKKKTIESDIQTLNIQLLNLKQQHNEKYEIIKDENILNESIENCENTILENEKNKEIHSNNLEEIDKYNKFIDDNKKYIEFEETITKFKQKEIEDRKKYTSANILKDKILEAESIAIQNIIENINIHASVYLEAFFEDPIIIRLLSFKETKKNNSKPQINVLIEYKENEVDLQSLSGGEIARVNLAFTLALSNIFNSRLLLLDESTASLDQELTSIVFDTIKETFKNTTVIVVAHQVIEGMFDNVIQL